MDSRYLEEEQILHDHPGFLDTDVLMLPPRGPGEPMWPEVMPQSATPRPAEPQLAAPESPDKAGKGRGTGEGPGGAKPAAVADKKAAGKDGKGSPQKAALVAEPAEVCVPQ